MSFAKSHTFRKARGCMGNERINTEKARKLLSISQIQLAEMLGISQSRLSNWEGNGGKVPDKYYKKVLDFFEEKGIDLKEIIIDDTNNTAPSQNTDDLRLVIATLQDSLADYRENYKKMESRFDILTKVVEKMDTLIEKCDTAIGNRGYLPAKTRDRTSHSVHR